VEISDWSVWSETAKGEERICKEKSVSEMSDFEMMMMIIVVVVIIILPITVAARSKA
jgi:hypothetical protein